MKIGFLKPRWKALVDARDGGEACMIAVASRETPGSIPVGLPNDGLIIASLIRRIAALEAELTKVRAKQSTVAP